MAGIPDVRLHDLRHSFASDALMGGVPLAVVLWDDGRSHDAIPQPPLLHEFVEILAVPRVSADTQFTAGAELSCRQAPSRPELSPGFS